MKTITLVTTALAISVLAAFALPALAAPATQVVHVTERDYRIAISPAPRAGRVTFVIRNVGEDGHDFWIRGGGITKKSRVVATGGTTRLTVILKKGVRYQFWCGVGSHAKKGMRGSFVAR